MLAKVENMAALQLGSTADHLPPLLSRLFWCILKLVAISNLCFCNLKFECKNSTMKMLSLVYQEKAQSLFFQTKFILCKLASTSRVMCYQFYLHKSTVVSYSKTSEQRAHWGRAFCPLQRGCPLLGDLIHSPRQIILEETTEMEQWPDTFQQSCSQFTRSTLSSLLLKIT